MTFIWDDCSACEALGAELCVDCSALLLTGFLAAAAPAARLGPADGRRGREAVDA